MFKIVSQISRKLKPVCAVWEITLKCNSHCIHCGSDAGKSRVKELNTEEALNLVKDLKYVGYKGIALMGGEPLIRDDWYQIAKEVKKNEMDLSIVTNGLNLEEKIDEIKTLGTDCVSISLDGGSSKTHDYLRGMKGSFQKTIEGLNLLEAQKIPTSIITSVSKQNLNELNGIKKIILDRNIAWQIQISVPIGRFPKDLVISREEYYALAQFIASNVKKYSYKRLPLIGGHCFGHFSRYIPNLGLSPWIGCQAGKTVLGIQSNGNIKGCLTLPDRYVEGNVREERLTEILKRIRLKDHQLKGYCAKCDVSKSCLGGCLGTALALKEFEHPYCLRAIENDMLNFNSLSLSGKLDSLYSKIKNLYDGLKI
ncbi:MAG: radical SAM/SPASM domain-containing protein [Promethearchaeota archaeon]